MRVRETVSATSAVSIKEDRVMNGFELATRSALNEQVTTPIKDLFDVRASVCSMYGVEFRNLVEEHDLGVREVRNGKVDVVLVNCLYDGQTDQNADLSEYDLLALEGSKTLRRC